jgi:hypothetical protein
MNDDNEAESIEVRGGVGEDGEKYLLLAVELTDGSEIQVALSIESANEIVASMRSILSELTGEVMWQN